MNGPSNTPGGAQGAAIGGCPFLLLRNEVPGRHCFCLLHPRISHEFSNRFNRPDANRVYVPSRRLREPGYSLSWRVLALVLILVIPGPILALPVEDVQPVPDPASHDPLEAWFLGDPATQLALPRDLNALLGSLTPRAPRASADSAWDAYFSALGVVPTAQERADLERAFVQHPALMAALDPVVRELAATQVARDAAFGRLTLDERAQLVHATLLLATGEADQLTPEERAVLSRVDLSRLESSAAALARDARALDAALPTASGVDARIDGALPDDLASAIAARDALAALAALGGPAAPAPEVSWPALLAALSPEAAASTARLPPDLAAPLARVVSVVLAAQATPGTEDDRAALATIAELTPALARASYNLSLRAPGDLDRLTGSPRPLEAMRASDDQQAALLLADLLGPAALPERVSLSKGYADLQAALGRPVDPEVAALESQLGPELSTAIGTVLEAQARYQTDLAPSAPIPALAAARTAQVAPLLDSSAPLTSAQVAQLADAAQANADLRALAGMRAGALLAAVSSLTTVSAAPVVPLTGTIYRSDTLVLLGMTDDDVSVDVVPVAPVLLVDLGGDDAYTGPVAGVDMLGTEVGYPLTSSSARSSLLVDLGGNDRYVAARNFTLGAARGAPLAPTLALLADAVGNDQYVSNATALGAGVDGFGLVLDGRGDDAYDVVWGLGLAESTDLGALSAGILVDGTGADHYKAKEGFAHLRSTTAVPTTLAAFIEVSGPDTYVASCPPQPAQCFGTPRSMVMPPDRTPGVIVFVDGGGDDTWPKASGAPSNEQAPYTGAVDPNSPFDGVRVVLVSIHQGVADRDGDLLIDQVEGSQPGQDLGMDPKNSTWIDPELTDGDGDGWPDYVEGILHTSPTDPNSAPVGVPRPPPPAPNPYDSLPNGGHGVPGRPASSNFLLNLPGRVAIGLPGTTVYTENYTLSIDLGLDATSSLSVGAAGDRYYGETAQNTIAIDLGGNDVYAPLPYPNDQPRHLARSTGGVALLLDLGGADRYVVERDGLARATFNGFAALIDAAGSDQYLSPRGTSQSYGDFGGHAFLLDLGSDDKETDTYVSQTQGVAEDYGSSAVFVDAAGEDTYYRPPREFDDPAWLDHQGYSPDVGVVGANVTAVFMDLGGADHYRIAQGSVIREATERNNRLRVRPLDDPRGGAVAVFLDTTLAKGTAPSDQDGDGTSDAVETGAGTSSQNATDDPNGGAGFLLNLPRIGVAIGGGDDTRYERDYALVVDMGGWDTYLNHAGASSPAFPTSLLVDHGVEPDEYVLNVTTNLTSFFPYVKGGNVLVPAASVANPYPAAVSDAPDAALGVAQGAGVYGVGILIDGGGANRFVTNVTTRTCETCRTRSIALGVAQGASLVGVGILDVQPEGGANEFTVRTFANFSNVAVDAAPGGPFGISRGIAQGATVLGVGILASEGERTADQYVVDARTAGRFTASAAAAQGYALHGLGVLLDEGGSNGFVGGDLAQAAADDDPLTLPVPPTISTTPLGPSWAFTSRARPTVAMLLLPGVGDDALVANAQAQSFAGIAGTSVLFDAEGDDTRDLLAPVNSSGQASANATGLAYLIDDRGDDAYTARGDFAQASAIDGVAVLVDLSGTDTYRARNQTQGHIRAENFEVTSVPTRANAATPVAALFIDRMGLDHYVIAPNASAQGGANLSASSSTPGAGVFVDGGGDDLYEGRAVGQDARPTNGNGGSPATPWVTRAAPFFAGGIDTNELGNAMLTFADKLYSTTGTGAALTVRTEDKTAAWPTGEPVNWTVTLRAGVFVNRNENTQAGGAFDRADFTYGGRPLAQATPVGGVFDHGWNTSRRSPSDRPLYPDGVHTLQAFVYPRAGTPTATDGTGRRVAIDPEPLPASLTVRIDNPPQAQWPLIPIVSGAGAHVSTAWADVRIPLWIDRDLEGQCVDCEAVPIPAAPVDAWATGARAPPVSLPEEDDCEVATCAPRDVSVVGGAGAAYLTWSPPVNGTPARGYLVVRNESGTFRALASIDTRAPLRYRDAAPQEGTSYLVAALDALGQMRSSSEVNYTASFAPGPVTSLNAVAAESSVAVSWAPVPGATSYVVERNGGVVGTATGTSFVDTGLPNDATFTYRVTPVSSFGVSGVRQLTASATPAPGARVTLVLQSGDDRVVLLDDHPLAGGQVVQVPWNAASAPEGTFDLRVRLQDGVHDANETVMRNVTIDRTAPDTSLLLPGIVGATYLGSGGVRVPIVVTDAAGGAARVVAAARIEGGPWQVIGDVLLSNTTLAEDGSGAHLVNVALGGAADGQHAEIVAVAVDHAGNVGGLAPLPWKSTLADGLLAAEARGGSVVTFDFLPPIVRGSAFEPFVRPGTTLHLKATAADSGSGLKEVRARIGATLVPLVDQGNFRFAADWVATEVGAHQVVFESEDNAGNLARDPAGLLVVDDEPPVVEAASVTFSGGRLVGTPGESARVVIRVKDNASLAETLNVTLDATNVSSRQPLRLAWSRLDQVFAGEIVVDRVQPVSERNVSVRVADRAGNAVNVTIPVPIDAVPAGFASPVAVAAHADRAWLNWTTDENVSARVSFGIGPQLGSQTELGPVGKNHSILVTGLTPATRYFFKAVAVTHAGIETTSPLLEATTTPGLVVTLDPLKGFPYGRGPGTVDLVVRAFDGTPAATASAEVFVIPPRGSPALIADAPSPGGVDVDLGGFRDGTYQLVARAKAGDLTGQSAPLTVVLDRAAPIVDLSPDAVVMPGALLNLTALERGSGIDLDKVAILVDGRPCVATLRNDTLSCAAPEVRNATVRVNVTVADRAGNVGVLRTSLPAASREGVLLREALLLGDQGFDALRPGSQATLTAEVDGLGVQRVVADLRTLGGAAEQELAPVAPGLYRVAVDVPASARAGPVNVPVAATDLAGRTRHLFASAFIDGTPPRAEEIEILSGARPGSVAIHVIATEPVRLRADAPGAHAQRDDPRVDAQVTLVGLRPGRTFQVLVTLTDRAGNQAVLTPEVTTPPDERAPDLVQDLDAFDLGDGRVVLTWAPGTDDVGIDGYRVYRKEGDRMTLLATVTEPRYEADLPAGVDVPLAVAAVDLGGNEGEATGVTARSVALPHLEGGRVEPPLGGPGLYEFRVNVTQKAGAPPVVEVLVDGRPVRMTTDADSCVESCAYTALVTLGPQPLEGTGHQFAFIAHHDGLSVRLPDGGQAIPGPVVVGNVKSSVLQGASRVTLTPVLGLVGVLAAAGAIVAWRTLRRKGN